MTADIALEVNKDLAATRVLAYIRIQRLPYNKKGNLSGLMGMTATSSMILPPHRELLLQVARKFDLNIIDVTGNQRWHHLQVHGVDLNRYGRQ